MKKLVALVIALAVLVGGWWYASPLMALDGLRDAAQSGDQTDLEQRVDFPALRSSVKEQLRGVVEQLRSVSAAEEAAVRRAENGERDAQAERRVAETHAKEAAEEAHESQLPTSCASEKHL